MRVICFHLMLVFGRLKRKLNGLVCLSVFAWLLCPCCLSVRLCLLVFLCLAVFRRYCCVCGLLAVLRLGLLLLCRCWGASVVCCVSFFLCPALVDLGVGFTSGFSRGFHVMFFMSCFDFLLHAYPALVFVGWVCVRVL